MDVILYVLIFAIGTLFGSFFALAIYRIPLKENIVYKHSYCPNCKHKLNFFDLVPIFSYIFLRGKCKYCKNKISPRYLIIEFLTGTIFVLIAAGLKLKMIDLINIFYY